MDGGPSPPCRTYNQLLADCDLQLPPAMAYARHVYHVYAVRVHDRDACQQMLAQKGIQTGIHYPIPAHLQECFSDLGHRAGDFPHSELAANQVLSLPMYPELSAEQLTEVSTALHAGLRFR
jgi:dTDP-4-amino-4,6-dideoxygalactose transaminase